MISSSEPSRASRRGLFSRPSVSGSVTSSTIPFPLQVRPPSWLRWQAMRPNGRAVCPRLSR